MIETLELIEVTDRDRRLWDLISQLREQGCESQDAYLGTKLCGKPCDLAERIMAEFPGERTHVRTALGTYPLCVHTILRKYPNWHMYFQGKG